MTTQTVKYTAEQVEVLVARYTEAPTAATVEALATETGRTVKSVVAKLAQLGVYRKAEKAAGAAAGVTKLTLAQVLAPNDEVMQNDLVKLTKATLVKLQAAAVAE